MKSIELPEMKLNNLCSHYKDSYDIHRETIKRRDKLFYSLLAIIAIFTLQVTSTEEVNTILSKYILKQGINLSINFHFISTLIWLILLGFSIRYFQIVIEIQRQYSYLHKLEEELNKYYKNTVVFTREGKSYFQNYPLFSNWLWLLYTAFFPMLILISIYYQTFPDRLQDHLKF
ncbi:MAG: hypothetical protein OMM_02377 [Candidatus Magnetoglobus multicellularis str. Araruama]|uniref:Uncharacterized protein n=1 Tax=Candidatus Magnetoglobus multicellularis str. Araruama TaxID=890399 RepID=A0A1V1P9J6_9BACT|nr:MAG: hypothetical protein OMM_02377 [Candidatus Magnetoglobus multicellularis str. Araruama]